MRKEVNLVPAANPVGEEAKEGESERAGGEMRESVSSASKEERFKGASGKLCKSLPDESELADAADFGESGCKFSEDSFTMCSLCVPPSAETFSESTTVGTASRTPELNCDEEANDEDTSTRAKSNAGLAGIGISGDWATRFPSTFRLTGLREEEGLLSKGSALGTS